MSQPKMPPSTRPHLIPVTISTSDEYIDRCASSTSRASLIDPFTLILQAEKLPPTSPTDNSIPTSSYAVTTPPQNKGLFPTSLTWPSDLEARLANLTLSQISSMIHDSASRRLHSKLSANNPSTAFIAEAGNWAACICWELLSAPPPTSGSCISLFHDTADLIPEAASIAAEGRTLFAKFIDANERVRQEKLYPLLWKHFGSANDERELNFWKIAVLSRDPARPRVDGAVRACIGPFLKALTVRSFSSTPSPSPAAAGSDRNMDGTEFNDGIERIRTRVVWLEAGNPRARDLYLRFGFEVVGHVDLGDDVDRVRAAAMRVWFMMYIAPS